MNIPEAITKYAKSYGPDYRAHRINKDYFQIAPDGDEPVGLPIVVTMDGDKVLELDPDTALAVLSVYLED